VFVSRRKFTNEFRLEACKLVTEGGQKIAAASRDLGIPEGVLGRWVRESRGVQTVEPSAAKRIRELESENRRLRLEREILKKAMAYFVEAPK
jgi:transposase